MKIGFIGVGKLGQYAAEVMAEKHNVIGYDINEVKPSHLDNKDFDYSIVKEVLSEVDKHTNKDQLVILISTVLPGTIRREFIPLCNNFRFIYNPYLIIIIISINQ